MIFERQVTYERLARSAERTAELADLFGPLRGMALQPLDQINTTQCFASGDAMGFSGRRSRAV